MLNNFIININSLGIQKTNKIYKLLCKNDSELEVVKSFLAFLNVYVPIDNKKIKSNRIINDILKDTIKHYTNISTNE